MVAKPTIPDARERFRDLARDDAAKAPRNPGGGPADPPDADSDPTPSDVQPGGADATGLREGS